MTQEPTPSETQPPLPPGVELVKRTRPKAVLGIVVFVVVIAFFSVRAFNTAQAVTVNWRPVNLADLLLSFLLVLICYGVTASVWWFQVRLLGERFAFRSALQSYFLSSLPRYVPGFIWGYWGRAYLSERSGAKRSAIVASIGLEMGLFIGTGLAVGLFYWLPTGEGTLVTSAMVVVVALSLSVVILINGKKLKSARQWLRSLSVSFLIALVYVGFWILYGLSVFVLVRAISPAESQDLVMRVISGFALSWLAGFFAVFVPGGLGVREGVLIIILEPVIGGVPAVFVSFMSRLVNILCDGLLFLVAMGDRKISAKFKTTET
jgi:uncharacterized membrane protein YbhN (UPF0104 family)